MNQTINTGELPSFDKLWNYSRPAETEAKFRAILPDAVRAGDASYHLQLLTQIARCLGLQGRFDEAHAVLDEVQPRLTDELAVARVRYLLERGRVFNTAGQSGDAMPLFVQAVEIARGAGAIRLEIDAIHMVAIVAPTPDEKVAWNLRGIDRVNENPSETGWLFSLCNNLGEVYLLLHRYDEALASFEKLVEVERGRGHEPWIFTIKDIAKCLRLLGRADEALKQIEPVHRKLTEQGERDGYISEELAECLLALGRADDARPHFAVAYDLLSQDAEVQREPARLARLKAMTG